MHTQEWTVSGTYVILEPPKPSLCTYHCLYCAGRKQECPAAATPVLFTEHLWEGNTGPNDLSGIPPLPHWHSQTSEPAAISAYKYNHAINLPRNFSTIGLQLPSLHEYSMVIQHPRGNFALLASLPKLLTASIIHTTLVASPVSSTYQKGFYAILDTIT